ncbi:MAG: hypothetical protein ACR2P5_09535 [Gammaproteobacteria bacterium]
MPEFAHLIACLILILVAGRGLIAIVSADFVFNLPRRKLIKNMSFPRRWESKALTAGENYNFATKRIFWIPVCAGMAAFSYLSAPSFTAPI